MKPVWKYFKPAFFCRAIGGTSSECRKRPIVCERECHRSSKGLCQFPTGLDNWIELNWIDSATNGWQSWQRLQNFSMCRLRLLLHDYSVSRHLLCRQMLSPDFSMYRSSCEVFGVHEINSKCTRGATMTQHLKQEWFYRWSPQTFLPPHLLGLSVWLWLHHNW